MTDEPTEWEVCIKAYGPDDEAGDARWEHYHPRAETEDEAREKAVEEATKPGLDAIIGIQDAYDVVNIDGPFATDGGEPDVTEHVLEWIEEHTEPEPDGVQDGLGNVWAGGNQLKAQARKDRIPFEVDELEVALDDLLEAGRIITWHGLVAPATDEHLEAVVENEAQCKVTRSILVGKANHQRALNRGVSSDD